jgi:hypothetical protein
MDNIEGEYNNWKYKILKGNDRLPIKMEVLPDFEIKPPDELCKYYSFNDYNLDSLNGRYFYGSHPYDLNDPFDFNKNLIQLNSSIQNELYQFYFSQFGILSMTESETDPLMWSHYCSHRGFVVKYLINKIPNYFFGPFPINYIEKYVPIISSNLLLTLLIASNIKYKEHWSKEKEWRFLLYSPKRMKLPKHIQSQLKDRCTRRRYFYYSDNLSIKEVILGYKLLLNDNVKLKIDQNKGFTLLTRDCLLIKFLNLLYSQKIKTYIVDVHPTSYSEFIKKEISINPVRNNKFILEFID